MAAIARTNAITRDYRSENVEINALDPQGPNADIATRQLVVRCLDRFEAGLVSASVSLLSVVDPMLAGGARIRYFLRLGVQFEPVISADGAPSSEHAIERLLHSWRTEVVAHLGHSCEATACAKGDIRRSLGGDLDALPCHVGVYKNWASPQTWKGPVTLQPMLDCMLTASGPSAIGLMVAKVYGNPRDQTPAHYHVAAMTLGLQEGSPVFPTLAAEMTGGGRGMVKPALANVRPTMEFAALPFNQLNTQFGELQAFSAADPQPLGVSPRLDGEFAAFLLGLPRKIFE